MTLPRIGVSLPLAAAAVLSLSACGGGDAIGGVPAPHPTERCFDLDCGVIETVARIPDAENLLFSPQGRLFVSGGTQVFEIQREPNGAFRAQPLSATECNFTGLAIRAETLYANCFDGQLYAAPLSAVQTLAPIANLGVASPNGLAVGPDDALYLANGPLATSALPDPRLLRVRLDPTDPLQVEGVGSWLDEGLLAPNGLQRSGETFYVSDSELLNPGVIRTVRWTPQGPAEAQVLSRFTSLPDDLSLLPAADGVYVIATEFVSGGLRLIAPDGTTVASLPSGTFSSPTQARAGQPPLFSSEDLLVTEKGLIGDTQSPLGNRLSVLRRRVD